MPLLLIRKLWIARQIEQLPLGYSASNLTETVTTLQRLLLNEYAPNNMRIIYWFLFLVRNIAQKSSEKTNNHLTVFRVGVVYPMWFWWVFSKNATFLTIGRWPNLMLYSFMGDWSTPKVWSRFLSRTTPSYSNGCRYGVKKFICLYFAFSPPSLHLKISLRGGVLDHTDS